MMFYCFFVIIVIILLMFYLSGPGCGGSIFNTRGSITSYKFPENANRTATDCRWQISVPLRMLIKIEFTSNFPSVLNYLIALHNTKHGFVRFLIWAERRLYK